MYRALQIMKQPTNKKTEVNNFYFLNVNFIIEAIDLYFFFCCTIQRVKRKDINVLQSTIFAVF